MLQFGQFMITCDFLDHHHLNVGYVDIVGLT
jgi:hypothetical protein